jgi:hypothetical protein
MFNLEEINQTETQAATQPLDTFQPQDNPLSAIKSMDSSRNNAAVEDMLGNCLIAFEDPQPTPTPDAPKDSPKDSPKEKTETPIEQAEKAWEQADKFRQQAVQDCRQGNFKDAKTHAEQARLKYNESWAKNPADTPEEQAQQKVINNQLSQILSVIRNESKVGPKWEPPGGLNLPKPEIVTPKPRMDQTPINEMIEK